MSGRASSIARAAASRSMAAMRRVAAWGLSMVPSIFCACLSCFSHLIESSLVCVAKRGSFMVRMAQRCCFQQGLDSCEKLVRCDGLREVDLEAGHQCARAILGFGVTRKGDRGDALHEGHVALRFER